MFSGLLDWLLVVRAKYRFTALWGLPRWKGVSLFHFRLSATMTYFGRPHPISVVCSFAVSGLHAAHIRDPHPRSNVTK